MSTKPTERSKPSSDHRLDEIFGRDLGVEEPDVRGEQRARENWYRENRPPHHESP